LKNYYKAENLYNKVHANHNLYIGSQKNIAINKSKLGFFKDGEQQLLKLINKDSNSYNLLVALADLYRVEKKYDKAVTYYSKVIDLQNNSFSELWRLLYLRGICFEKLSQWNLAEKDFLHSLKIKPNSPQVLNYLAYGWLERDQKLNQAIEMLLKAYEANPQSYYILDSLGWGYYKKNELQKAVDLMEQVIILAPGEAISLDHLGDIYFAMKRKREAKYLWKQALDLTEPEEMIEDILKKKLDKLNSG
jgi:tetratricopeptide (TPR) repeat protein